METEQPAPQLIHPQTTPDTSLPAPSPAPATPPAHAHQDPDAVSWQASEYIHHEKDFSWFAGLVAFGVVLVALLAIFADVVSAVVVAIMFVALIVFSKRPPRVLRYQIDRSGISIEQKHYPFNELKSFSLHEEGGFASIQLIPVKRFMPAISIYFSQEDGEKIIDILADHLPHEDRAPDIVDRFFERLRF